MANIDELLNYPIVLSQDKILVIDDSPYLLAAMLRKYGYTIETETQSDRAFETVLASSPDLVLLDITMPGQDGYSVCRSLKANSETRDIPVIFISARNETLDKIEAFQVGGSDYISKNFQFAEILVRVENQLNQRRLQKQLMASEAKAREKSRLLGQALEQIKQTQSQLVHQAKMSSLGQLVAGVAHEINNPVNFVYGNLTYLAEYTENMMQLLGLYQTAVPEPTAEIAEAIEEIDLDFIQTDLPRLIDSMRIGTERIQDIVRSLRNFSRHDEADLKSVNLHDGIDNSLIILQHRLKASGDRGEIQIVRKYGDLPPVECHAGQLNQVFTNILANAIDALETKRKDRSIPHPIPQITIETQRLAGDRVRVSIADNGAGMLESVRQRMFDPFFTTKDIGVGTGLGMSISYQIVTERHGGHLSCQSVPGKGTTLSLELPIRATQTSSPPDTPAPAAALCQAS
jgi:signal transduction histidine kinase